MIAQDAKGPADLIVYHAHIVTVDNQFRTVEAIAIIWRLAEGKLTELELASWIRQNNEAADD